MTSSHRSVVRDALQLRRELLLIAQVALLGEVPISLRGVTLGWSETEIRVRAVFHGELHEDDRESMECVASEIIASFPRHTIEVEIVRLDAPARLNDLLLTAWVFVRKEPGADSSTAESQ